MLAIALSSVLVGLGSARTLTHRRPGTSTISTTRLLLLAAGVVGIFAGVGAFRQMDDKQGVPVLADLWGSLRGRPLGRAGGGRRPGRVHRLRGRRGRRQVDPGRAARRAGCARQGRDVVVTREPGATEVGARIRSLLLDRPDGPVALAPRAEALLYAADRAHHVATVVRPALARGAVVISDRYVDSSLAYQGAGRTLPVEEVSWLSAWATGGLKPDLVVLLDVDPAAGLARVGRAAAASTGWRASRWPSTSGSGTPSSTSPPPTRSATWWSTPPAGRRASRPRGRAGRRDASGVREWRPQRRRAVPDHRPPMSRPSSCSTRTRLIRSRPACTPRVATTTGTRATHPARTGRTATAVRPTPAAVVRGAASYCPNRTDTR